MFLYNNEQFVTFNFVVFLLAMGRFSLLISQLLIFLIQEGVGYKPGSVSRARRDGDHFSKDPRCPGSLAAYPG